MLAQLFIFVTMIFLFHTTDRSLELIEWTNDEQISGTLIDGRFRISFEANNGGMYFPCRSIVALVAYIIIALYDNLNNGLELGLHNPSFSSRNSTNNVDNKHRSTIEQAHANQPNMSLKSPFNQHVK